MLSLHNVGHLVSMVIIAALIHTILELRLQMDDLLSVCSCQKQSKHGNSRSPSTLTQNSDSGVTDEMTFDPSRSKNEVSKQGTGFHSSVWCRRGDQHFCRITNLCYHGNTEEFFIVRDENSIFENIDITDGVFTLDLSSISNHNVYQMEVFTLPGSYSETLDVQWRNTTTLIFKPFLPGNIMHVFHDDLIPLYHSLQHLNGRHGHVEHNNVDILALEDLKETEFEDLYNIFTSNKILYQEDFRDKEVSCFKEAYVGLLPSTVWYYFGFTKPQAAVDGATVSGSHIRQTVRYIRSKLTLSSDPVSFSGGDYLVFLTRKENRRILNEGELTLEIIKQVRTKVINMNFETHSIYDMIETVKNSKGLIGMHGSLLILSIFLEPGSIVIELFPYAINPSNYTPYKTLTELTDMDVVYKHWANTIPGNTVGHSDWPEELGGLEHLEPLQREIIMNQTEVPPHLCCSDPSWLYHIYQDTMVDIKRVSSLVKDALEESRNMKLSPVKYPFYPSKVWNVNCIITNQQENLKTIQNKNYFLHLSWRVPWTNHLLNELDIVQYEILIQETDRDVSSVSSHISTATVVSLNVERMGNYHVWVRCIINESTGGPYSQATICDHTVQ